MSAIHLQIFNNFFLQQMSFIWFYMTSINIHSHIRHVLLQDHQNRLLLRHTRDVRDHTLLPLLPHLHDRIHAVRDLRHDKDLHHLGALHGGSPDAFHVHDFDGYYAHHIDRNAI